MFTLKTNTLFKSSLLLTCFVAFFACKKKNDSTNNNTPAAGTTVVKDSITGNVHWTADQHYLLEGYVYVVDGATLTIDPGTVIKGDKDTKGSLIVERGAKIMAQGTEAKPIVFTSNQPSGSRTYGDWGGVILCGKAPVNWVAASTESNQTLPAGEGQVEGGPRSLYGGSDPNDNSGVLSYVRIEFAGVAFSPNNEVNGLSLAGVGNGTTLDHIQVSFSGDDAYEWFGGTVNAKYLICHRCWDDDLDNDVGYSGKVQFAMVFRSPDAADQSGSHSFESDSRNENSTQLPLNESVFSNVTAVGPLSNPADKSYNPDFCSGVIVRRSSSMSLYNSLIIGYPLGVIVDDDTKYGNILDNIKNKDLNIKNNAFVGMPSYAANIVYRVNDPHSAPNNTAPVSSDTSGWSAATGMSYPGPVSWLTAAENHNRIYPTEALSTRLTNPFNETLPVFVPTSTSAIVYNQDGKSYDSSKPIDTTAANFNAPSLITNFTDAKVSDSFFDKVDYVGAFGYTGSSSDNWASVWTNFDPVNTDYGSAY